MPRPAFDSDDTDIPADVPSDVPDDAQDDSWDDLEPQEELQPLDDSDLEIDDEPDPDERDFWLDPDETEDPWN